MCTHRKEKNIFESITCTWLNIVYDVEYIYMCVQKYECVHRIGTYDYEDRCECKHWSDDAGLHDGKVVEYRVST